MTSTNNKLSIGARLGKIAKYRAGLEDLREAIIKSDALGKAIKSSEYIAKHKMGTGVIQALIRLKAIEDKEPGGAYASGKFRWIYSNNTTGMVDQVLIEKTIDKENEIKKTHTEQTRQNRKEEPQEQGMKKLPTGKHDDMDKVVKWIEEELVKEDVVTGYLRGPQKAMYNRIVEILTGLKELKDVIEKLGL